MGCGCARRMQSTVRLAAPPAGCPAPATAPGPTCDVSQRRALPPHRLEQLAGAVKAGRQGQRGARRRRRRLCLRGRVEAAVLHPPGSAVQAIEGLRLRQHRLLLLRLRRRGGAAAASAGAAAAAAARRLELVVLCLGRAAPPALQPHRALLVLCRQQQAGAGHAHPLRKLHALQARQAVGRAHTVAARRALQQLERHAAAAAAAARRLGPSDDDRGGVQLREAGEAARQPAPACSSGDSGSGRGASARPAQGDSWARPSSFPRAHLLQGWARPRHRHCCSCRRSSRAPCATPPPAGPAVPPGAAAAAAAAAATRLPAPAGCHQVPAARCRCRHPPSRHPGWASARPQGLLLVEATALAACCAEAPGSAVRARPGCRSLRQGGSHAAGCCPAAAMPAAPAAAAAGAVPLAVAAAAPALAAVRGAAPAAAASRRPRHRSPNPFLQTRPLAPAVPWPASHHRSIRAPLQLLAPAAAPLLHPAAAAAAGEATAWGLQPPPAPAAPPGAFA